MSKVFLFQDVKVRVIAARKDERGFIRACIEALQGEPWTYPSDGGPVPSSTLWIPADLLRGIEVKVEAAA